MARMFSKARPAVTLTLVREIARYWFKCRRCDHRWTEYVRDITACPKCGGEPKLYGLEIEKTPG